MSNIVYPLIFKYVLFSLLYILLTPTPLWTFLMFTPDLKTIEHDHDGPLLSLSSPFPRKQTKVFFFLNANLIMSLFIFVVYICMLFNTYSLEEHLDMILPLSI